MIKLQYWGARLDAERSVGAIIIQARDTEGSDQRVDRVLEKGRSREEASFFGLSHRKGGAAIPGLGKASTWWRRIRTLIFNTLRLKYLKDLQMEMKRCRTEVGDSSLECGRDVWAGNRREGVVRISSHGVQ